MNIEHKIGAHTFCIRTSYLGSIDPWIIDIIVRYHIFSIGTDDIREYIRYDGKIYEVADNEQLIGIEERIQQWNEIDADDDVDEVIQGFINSCCDPEKGGYTISDALKNWGLEILEHLEFIRKNPEIYELEPGVFENMSLIFGEMVNKRCYLPREEYDIYAHSGSIIFDIFIYGDAIHNVSVDIQKDGFKYAVFYTDGSKYESALKEYSKENIGKFISVIKKKWAL